LWLSLSHSSAAVRLLQFIFPCHPLSLFTGYSIPVSRFVWQVYVAAEVRSRSTSCSLRVQPIPTRATSASHYFITASLQPRPLKITRTWSKNPNVEEKIRRDIPKRDKKTKKGQETAIKQHLREMGSRSEHQRRSILDLTDDISSIG
jgi:hypothetical protein